MSPFVCLFKPVVYGLYARAQLTEYGGDLFLFVGRNGPFAFAAKTAETAEGPVIAYGSLLIGETTPGDAMTTVEIPIEYYDRTTKPTGAYTLVISCTTSAYGDFKVGCLGNVMYVDDFEWVY